MTTLGEIRAKYPQYNDMPDAALADSFHAKFYPDMDKGAFYQKIGFSQDAPKTQDAAQNQPSFISNVAGGLGQSATDTMRGLAQLGLGGASRATNSLGFPETAQSLSGGLDYLNSQINNPTSEEAALRDSSGGKIGKLAGDILQIAAPTGAITGAVGVAGKLPLLTKVAARAAPYVGDALASFGTSYIQPEKEGESRGNNALINSALSVVGRGGAEGLGKFARAAKDPLIQAADKLGIPVGLAGMTENPFVRFLATQANNLSLTNPRGRAGKSFNRAVSKTFGENADELSPSVLAGAGDRIGGVMDAQYKSGIKDTTSLSQKLAEILRTKKGEITPSQYGSLEETVGDITGLIDNASLNPKAAENLSKTIRGRVSEAYKGSDSVLAGALKEPKNALEESLLRELGPEDAKSLLDSRKQYAALQRVKHLATTNSGNVTPGRLLNKVANETGDKLGSAGELGRVAEIGAKFLKSTVPDSGTPTRSLLIDMFKNHPFSATAGGAAAGAFAPFMTAGLVGGSTLTAEALHSPAVRKMFAELARGGAASAPQYSLPALGMMYQGEQ